MNTEQMKVLRTIIAAVETGGQIYGKCDYGDFTEAYTNSGAEHSVTVGAYQFYGTFAQKLLLRIREAGGEGFTEELNRYLDYSWTHLHISRESGLARTIVNVITTDTGKRCQDELIDEQLYMYCDEANDFGVTDARAQGMCANFRHQGGYGALKRIISKTNRPYTLENLYRACQSDTGNQVGTYRQRQKFVYNALKQHMPDEQKVDYGTLIENTREKAVQWMIDLANDDSHGYDQTYRWGEKGDYDCSSAVITAYRHAGLDLYGATYTGNMKAVFMNNGFIDVTGYVNLNYGTGLVRGDVLLNEVHHTAMYIGDGQEAEASINEFGGATGGQPGDQTGREVLIRPYRNYPWDCVLRYLGSAPERYRPVLRLYDSGDIVMTLQTLLNENGADLDVDGEFGNLTLEAVKDFQRRHLLEVDGIVGEKTWDALDHQTYRVIKTPGVVRECPRKKSKHIESLNAWTCLTVYGAVYNDINQKWYNVGYGYIIANNLERLE